jgi:hypothetical protein
MDHFAVHDFLGWRLGVLGRFVAQNPDHEHFPAKCEVLVGKEAIIFELPSLPSYATVSRFESFDYPLVSLVSLVGIAAAGRLTDSEVEALAFYSPMSGDPFTTLRIAPTSAGEVVCLVSDFMPNGLSRTELDAILLRFIDESVQRAERVRQQLELVPIAEKIGPFSRGVANKLSDVEIESLVGVRALSKRPKFRLAEVE